MSTLPDGISDTILNSAARYGGNIQIADFCPFVQVFCVYTYVQIHSIYTVQFCFTLYHEIPANITTYSSYNVDI